MNSSSNVKVEMVFEVDRFDVDNLNIFMMVDRLVVMVAIFVVNWFIESVVNSVLMELHWFNIMLIIVVVVEHSVILMGGIVMGKLMTQLVLITVVIFRNVTIMLMNRLINMVLLSPVLVVLNWHFILADMLVATMLMLVWSLIDNLVSLMIVFNWFFVLIIATLVMNRLFIVAHLMLHIMHGLLMLDAVMYFTLNIVYWLFMVANDVLVVNRLFTESVMDGMLMELHWLNIMLIIIVMVKNMMVLVMRCFIVINFTLYVMHGLLFNIVANLVVYRLNDVMMHFTLHIVYWLFMLNNMVMYFSFHIVYRLLMVAIFVMNWFIESTVDSMFMEMHRLDIMLIVVVVVESMMILVMLNDLMLMLMMMSVRVDMHVTIVGLFVMNWLFMLDVVARLTLNIVYWLFVANNMLNMMYRLY